jgi:hypothetical protein
MTETMTQHLIRALADVDVMALDLKEARKTLGRPHVLAGERSNAKLAKAGGRGWQTWGLSLAPAKSAGGPTVCPNATPGCMRFCVSGSGNAIAFRNVAEGRRKLTRLLRDYPAAFCRVLIQDVLDASARASSSGDGCAIRLNVFSDIEWERVLPVLFELMEPLGVLAYDYTKILGRTVPPSYKLTLSHSERNGLGTFEAWQSLPPEDRPAIAVPVDVKRGHALPTMWGDRAVVDGDADDRRFLDPPGVAVLLRSKVTRNGRGTASTGRGFILPILDNVDAGGSDGA